MSLRPTLVFKMLCIALFLSCTDAAFASDETKTSQQQDRDRLREWTHSDGRKFYGSFEYSTRNATTGAIEFVIRDESGSWQTLSRAEVGADFANHVLQKQARSQERFKEEKIAAAAQPDVLSVKWLQSPTEVQRSEARRYGVYSREGDDSFMTFDGTLFGKRCGHIYQFIKGQLVGVIIITEASLRFDIEQALDSKYRRTSPLSWHSTKHDVAMMANDETVVVMYISNLPEAGRLRSEKTSKMQAALRQKF